MNFFFFIKKFPFLPVFFFLFLFSGIFTSLYSEEKKLPPVIDEGKAFSETQEDSIKKTEEKEKKTQADSQIQKEEKISGSLEEKKNQTVPEGKEEKQKKERLRIIARKRKSSF